MAALDSAGFPTRPAANELIESQWGGAVRDRLIVKHGFGQWSDANALGAAIVDLFTVTIPVQQIATTLYLHATWWARSSGAGGGTGAGDAYLLGPNTPSAFVGPWVLPADGLNTSGLSLVWAANITAGQNPSYKIRFTGSGGPGLYRVLAQSSYLLVVT
jgi:hypothetical protein